MALAAQLQAAGSPNLYPGIRRADSAARRAVEPEAQALRSALTSLEAFVASSDRRDSDGRRGSRKSADRRGGSKDLTDPQSRSKLPASSSSPRTPSPPEAKQQKITSPRSAKGDQSPSDTRQQKVTSPRSANGDAKGSRSQPSSPKSERKSSSTSKVQDAVSSDDGLAKVHTALEQTHLLRQQLQEHASPHKPRDAFRFSRGFEITLDTLQFACRDVIKADAAASLMLLDLVHSTLMLLAIAMRGHCGNQKYFEARVREGGWRRLERALLDIFTSFEAEQGTIFPRDKIFGSLVAAAFDDESLRELFLRLGREKKIDWSKPDASGEATVKKSLGTPFLVLPEMLNIVFSLWMSWRSARTTAEASGYLATPLVLRVVSQLSMHALSSLHRVDLLSKVLKNLQTDDPALVAQLEPLAKTLLQLGIRHAVDAKTLYVNALSSKVHAKLLHDSICQQSPPSFLHLDLSIHGFASLELPDLGRSFPPMTSSAGYTISLWARIVQFDTSIHATLFGAFDQSQTCFILMYIEKDTRHLILQTSITSSRPSVRFKAFTFEADRWYHICLVHRRPRTATSSRASLFIDGEFIEQLKAQYPSPPPIPTPTDGDASPSKRGKHVQAFLGTPQDLATKLGPGAVTLQWQLASAHLFNEALNDDLIAVYKELGPRYYGNYQDCLGSFQTYEASAALNLRNESLHPGKEEKSEIVTAIRTKASTLLSEDHVLLSISANNVLGDSFKDDPDDSPLVNGLFHRALQNLRDATRGGRATIALNGALPSINYALMHQPGIAVLTGDPAVVIPTGLDDASWIIGGCAPVILSMLEATQTKDELLVCLDIVFNAVQFNWRNSEAMERENGFGVLGSLLTTRLQHILGAGRVQRAPTSIPDQGDADFLFNLLLKILEFVGFNASSPESSIINNPLAYRVLLVDLDIWRAAPSKVQKLYYEQFITFGVGSKHHIFNSRRLAHMRITKRWFESLKSEPFFEDTMDDFLAAFESLLNSSLSAEALRSLALYVTYAIHKSKDGHILRPQKSMKSITMGIIRRSTTPSPQPGVDISDRGSDRPLSRSEVGIRILGLYADMLDKQDHNHVKKFARTVTNKWLLNLLSDGDSRVIVLSTRILARILVVNGSSYVEKFGDKTGGFTIMRFRLRHWWNKAELWTLCFAILFGKDAVELGQNLDLGSLLDEFRPEDLKITYPAVLPVIIAMLQAGLKHIVQGQDDPSSPIRDTSVARESHRGLVARLEHGRKRAVSLQDGDENSKAAARIDFVGSVKMIKSITQFLAALHSSSTRFRDFAATSNYVQELLFLLFPVVVSSDVVSPETELNARDTSLTFQGSDVIIRPLSQASNKAAPIVRTSTVEATSTTASRVPALKRGSSFILVTSEESKYQPSPARLESIGSPTQKAEIKMSDSNTLVEAIMEIMLGVFSDQILHRKDFQGIGIFMKVPPGFQEHQAYFESFILRNLLSSINTTIQLEQKTLWEPRVITNLGRFCHHLDEAVYEGWFIDGAEHVLDFIGGLLEYFQQPDVQQLKSVRLCSEIIAGMRTIMAHVALLKISANDDTSDESKTANTLNKLTYWHTVLFATDGFPDDTMRLLVYLLYSKLISSNGVVRDLAANLWRLLVVQKAEQAAVVLRRLSDVSEEGMTRGLQAVTELDNQAFLGWVDDHRANLDALIFGRLSSVWEQFVHVENKQTQEGYRARVSKRREKLKGWAENEMTREDVARRHEINADHWRANIYSSEHLKLQRSLQDQHDNIAYNVSTWQKMSRQLHRPYGLLYANEPQKWQLDTTEGRNRMRLRLIPDTQAQTLKYGIKGAEKATKPAKLEVRPKLLPPDKSPIAASPTVQSFQNPLRSGDQTPDSESQAAQDPEEPEEEEFEIVDEPETENFEDKNRKVMRSLQRGDQVEHVHNISRIIGLEACEGLLIIGKVALYLIDNFFQRSDGEIVDAAQAPSDERDSYLQMISGKKSDVTAKPNDSSHETRSWRWDDILSISKRRFLFRDVAIEFFFGDGRSYLLTIHTPKLRDELYAKLMNRAQRASGSFNSPLPEDQWRIESLRMPEDNPQSLGSRFTNVFAQANAHPATKRWVKGEISNFSYLMLVNTMAGRTYNDLTQYPVFPWVLADYTSEELDLSDPRSFRDLSKPMGCQTPGRQAEFRERYQSFAEMGDQPPFHYGTHYSSAMIVTGYLIRLQPFVQSYLLLQGGHFDHPDRLFYSIEKAWKSASRENMSDVRELIPEFYYLPEMFTNANGFDFGVRQGTGGRIDNVVLPPWAKGDPKIFIAKHREALESEYVRENLHHWIDLVFGHKQQGDAALEATNVFHHLSYRGAKNLDMIDDPMERMATIGIIHNFGQTPHQVFNRVHLPSEDYRGRTKRLDSLAETLTRLPFPLLETSERVASLMYSPKLDRVLCTGPLRINVPPTYDKFLEWGFFDGSVRLYTSDGHKPLGLFEHLHHGQLATATFADSRTLITTGVDCVVSVWTLLTSSKPIDLVPRGNLFGHHSPITVVAIARSFSALLTASADGQVMLWDLNRLELVRALTCSGPVTCAAINDLDGTILIGHGPNVALYSLNGDLLTDQHVCAEGDDLVVSCAFYQVPGNEWPVRQLVLTGHRRGAANIWSTTIHNASFGLALVKRLVHVDATGTNIASSITSVLPLEQAVYTGDSDGRVWEWDCIQRNGGL